MPERLPVVDGDTNADVYGHATTKAGAIRVGRREFVDGCVDAYVSGPIALRTGGSIERAWVALTPYGAGTDMPEFIMPIGSGEAADTFCSLDPFTQAYITAAFFTECEPGTVQDATDENCRWDPEIHSSLPGDVTFDDLHPDTLKAMVDDCREFQARMDGAVAAAGMHENMRLRGSVEDEWTQAGHDFWLTRNGHGAGFWDGDWPEPYATQLTAAAEGFGEASLYIGDDGFIHGD